jgi:DNA polymerase-1
LLLQVHDELVFDLYRPEEEVLKELVTRHMRDALPLQGLPVEVSVGIADNWLDAH